MRLAALTVILLYWTPALENAANDPLPADAMTEIVVSDCNNSAQVLSEQTFALGVASGYVYFPGTVNCECAAARTVVPSYPEGFQESTWSNTVQRCTVVSCHSY